MTPALRFRVIGERNLLLSMEMSFFGMPLYILDSCLENRDESNENSIVKLWLQFILIFRALHSQLRKGHTKKRHLHAPHMHLFPAKGHEIKKTPQYSFALSFLGDSSAYPFSIYLFAFLIPS